MKYWQDVCTCRIREGWTPGCNLTCRHPSARNSGPIFVFQFYSAISKWNRITFEKSFLLFSSRFSLLSALIDQPHQNYRLQSKLFQTNRGGFCEMHKVLRHQQPGETSIPSAPISSHVIKLGRPADVCGHPTTYATLFTGCIGSKAGNCFLPTATNGPPTLPLVMVTVFLLG